MARSHSGLDVQPDNLVMLQFRAGIEPLRETEADLQCRPYCKKHTHTWSTKCAWSTSDCSGCRECFQVLRDVYDHELSPDQLQAIFHQEQRDALLNCTGADCDLEVARNHGGARSSNQTAAVISNGATADIEEDLEEQQLIIAQGYEAAQCQSWCKAQSDSWVVKCGWSTQCGACSDCEDLPQPCELWCEYHSSEWYTKCQWYADQCNGCAQCKAPRFVIMVDEMLDPPCDPSLEQLRSLGYTNTLFDCESRIQAVAAMDDQLNYGFWQGDSNNECLTCSIQSSRFAISYADLTGRVSFVKLGTCQYWCAENTNPWRQKCGWENRVCSGCMECPAHQCQSVICPTCEEWCTTKTESWETKCGWKSWSCRGCNECSQTVSAGVFTLFNPYTGSYLGIEHLGVEARGEVVEEKSSTDSRTQWKLNLDIVSGSYTAQNVYTNEYLGLKLREEHWDAEPHVHNDSSTRWVIDLVGNRHNRMFVLKSQKSGWTLTGNRNNVSLRLNASDKPEAQWQFRSVEEGMRGTPYPTMPPTPPTPAPTPDLMAESTSTTTPYFVERTTTQFMVQRTTSEFVDLASSDLLINNLGGLGPDPGNPALRFHHVAPGVDLMVSNISLYTPWNISAIGATGDNSSLGQISLACGESVALQFSFVDTATSHPLILPVFYFTVADIDTGIDGNCTESVMVTDYADFLVTPETTIEVTPSLGGNRFVGSAYGTSADNPTSAEFTAEQANKAIAFRFEDVQTFTVTFHTDGLPEHNRSDLEDVGYAGRRILFAGETSLSRSAAAAAVPSSTARLALNSSSLDDDGANVSTRGEGWSHLHWPLSDIWSRLKR